MISPLDLQNAIVDKLRAIPELVSFIGDVAEIQAYDDESQTDGDWETTEFGMQGRAVMVMWTGTELPRTGETRGWKHSFKIALKSESIQAYFQAVKLIIDGVPTGDGIPAGEACNFLNSTFQACDGIQELEILPERGDDHVGRLSIQFTITEW